MEIKLVVVGGRHANQKISVRRAAFLIGRDKECQLRLGCNLVSRRHCALLLQDERLLIEDLHSTNGTFLNGEQIEEPQVLHHGDRVNVGSFEFQVQATDAAADEARAAAPDTITDMPSDTPTNHGGVTGREIGLDLLKLDTTIGGSVPAKAKDKGKKNVSKKSTTRESGNSPDSIIVCSEDVTCELD